jgi:aminoglycoside 3-N-acetyltransferase
MSDLSKSEVESGLRESGVRAGDVTLVHSAMRTMGPVEGGAQTVVDALLELLGSTGTLVVPTFTFAHEATDDPIIDPAADRSEMGIITETARLHPDARRSTAFRHSFAAIGKRSQVIAENDPAMSPFDLRSSFGVMTALNTKVMLFGVTYSSSTSHHFAEFVCDVPYRQTIPMAVKVRQAAGGVVELPMLDYQPKSEGGSYYGSRGPDFNRLGQMLEDRGLVKTTFIGNAAVRRFAMRDLLDLAQVEAAKDYNVFRTADGEPENTTELKFGRSIDSPVLIDGAGREHAVEWCVKDVDKLTLPNPQ